MARGKAAEQGKILERQLQSLELRKNGMSYRAIGERLGVSHVQAYNDVHDELKRLASQVTDKTTELRQLELERLDMLLNGLWPMAAVGNTGAVMSWLKVSERRAKLLGLDAPTHIQVDDWRSQAIADIRAGKVTYEDLVNGFDTSLAAALFAEAGVPVSSRES
jgi:hypothetical protein